ncbi:hypothetical protein CK503_10150 [Aliifodinibius salipaludis]|uniref:Soluble ligand binding domain-containing protein n=1 Tax=Fodinibius salipaludis TaxID=2032627 RepID=A0A2A2G8D4_9BACT|nr:hypothetical protein [Aliifodinibius salipaludis]PAU94016.1 hypothetical protein CK503_10150 [Aliifodinibius salipaludis]
MKRNLIYITLLTIIGVCSPLIVQAQLQLEEGMGDRYIRVAEIGQLADSVNVWGDVGSSGRYIIPEETTLPELISYSFGYTQLRGRDSNIDWSKTQIEIKVSRYNEDRKLVDVAFFRYRYHDPEPVEMFEFDLQNNDLVSVQVRRKPSFTDYVGVVAPVVSVIATSFLLFENLRGN